jgi:hypothetical protein
MEEDIDQMKTPGLQTKEMIIEHINNVHEGPVIVRNESWLETQDTP